MQYVKKSFLIKIISITFTQLVFFISIGRRTILFCFDKVETKLDRKDIYMTKGL